jgi:hypothetical protein
VFGRWLINHLAVNFVHKLNVEIFYLLEELRMSLLYLTMQILASNFNLGLNSFAHLRLKLGCLSCMKFLLGFHGFLFVGLHRL